MSNLRPYHAFEIDGNHYVYSVWGMDYRRVTAQTVDELAKEASGEAAGLGCETLEAIKELGLRWSDTVTCLADMRERDRRSLAAARQNPAAIHHVALFVAQECNMRCPYCYGAGGRYGSGGAMSEETAFRAVDWLIGQAGDGKEMHIAFFGGEPLLNFPLIEKVVAYARGKAGVAKKLGFGITSNLSLLDDRILDCIVANEMKVLASFDGPREIQNRNRPLRDGRDSYDTVVPKIRKLVAALPESCVRSTLVAGDDPSEVAPELLALGFRQVHIEAASGCLITGGPEASGCRDPAPGPHEGLNVFHRGAVARLRRAVAGRDPGEVRALSRLRNVTAHLGFFLHGNDILHALGRRRRYFYCGRATMMVAIAANGDIYPCHRFVGAQAFRMGNVLTGEFHRTESLRSPLEENPECASCWARYVCGGNCQHDNAAATGDPLRPDPRSCADMRARIEYAIHAADCLGNQELRWLAELGIMKDAGCCVDFCGAKTAPLAPGRSLPDPPGARPKSRGGN